MDKIISLLAQEKKRQRETLMMIPSENYTYPEVFKVVGSCLMHKYSEGQPAKRYYQGNSIVDEIELLCKHRALQAFGLSEKKWSANVQPHSGCEANLAVYNALLKPGDKILSMYLPDGGHLSHGWHLPDNPVTLASKIYDVHFYHSDPKIGQFNYDQISALAKKIKPKLIISGGTAYPRQIKFKALSQIAKKVGALYLADVSHEAGLIAGGAYQSPFPWADVVTFTAHKTLRGPRGAVIISRSQFADQIDHSVFPGLQGGPHNHTIAGMAIALQKAHSPAFKKYAHQVIANAHALARELQKYKFDLISHGTDSHLLLIDLRSKKINGWFAAWALEKAGIIVNRNSIPGDTNRPYYPSGLRLGTPAITTRGMKKTQMKAIANWINQVIDHLGSRQIPQDKADRSKILKAFKQEITQDNYLLKIKKEVKSLCKKYPI